MLQKIEDLSPTTRKLTINVPLEVIKSETDKIYNHIRATTKIPGFRPGKIPQAILVKKFSKNVEAQVIEKIIPEFYIQAIHEAKIEPISYPDMSDRVELKPDEPLTFSVTVEIKPQLGDIDTDNIVLKEKAVSVEDDEIERAIDTIRESKALYTVTDEALKEGDMAILDSEAYVDDKLMEEMSYKEFPFVIGSNEMPKEFTDGLVDKKKGDKADIKISFDSNHPNKTIAGKEILFKLTIAEGKKKNIPPIDDDFAKESDCDNVAALKDKIRDSINERKKGQVDLDYKKDILNELIKRHDFDIPESMLKGEVESLVERAKQEAMQSGIDLKPDEKFIKDQEPKAKDNIKGVLLLEAIGKKEKIEVNDDDVKKAIEEIAVRSQLKPEEVTKLYSAREGSMEALKSRLFADKTLDLILSRATIEK